MEPEKALFKHKVVLIRINKLFRPNMNAEELYEATRGVWKLDTYRAEKADYAMAIYKGIIREVYKAKEWHKAKKNGYTTRTDLKFRDISDRKEFEGEPAEEGIREYYIGKFVKFEKGNQNPINYVNC
jgi:uncharacterized protein